MIEVIKPGSACVIGGSIRAMVVLAQLGTSGEVAYQVAWWDGAERRMEWLDACEVHADENGEMTRFGFVKGKA